MVSGSTNSGSTSSVLVKKVTRTAFAASGAATGIISTGVSYFLLLYYNQVLGLDASLAGLALMIALVVDALSDPLIGRWSDRLEHRWGRRHPFLYVSIAPIVIAYYLLWQVPSLSQMGLFFYLLALIVFLRISITLHAVPMAALIPELAPDYDGRTTLTNDQNSAGWFIGAIFAVLMYAIWLADTPEYPDGYGVLRADGYVEAATVCCLILLLCLTFAALATRSHIQRLSAPPAGVGTLREMMAQGAETLRERNFLAMATAGVFSAAAGGTGTALWVYMQPYFWGLNSEQTGTLLTVTVLSAVIAFIAVPFVTRARDKKPVLIATSILSLLLATVPAFLMILDLFLPRGTDELFYALLVREIFWTTTLVMSGTLTASLLADVVDARAAVTGRREEGLVYSVQSFVGKSASGAGIFAAGTALSMISFPQDTDVQNLTTETMNHLGLVYAITILVFSSLAVYALTKVTLDRKTHELNLMKLEQI